MCKVEGCERKIRALGLCEMHYGRQRRLGTTERGTWGRARAFFDEAKAMETDECILWPFAKTSKSPFYGTIRGHKETSIVNRLMCIEVHGHPPTPQHESAHNCGVSLCINKRHLRWATPLENTADRKIHGTEVFGEKVINAKLSAAKVVEIRSLRGRMSNREIAGMFGVSKTTISSVMTKQNWAWVA
jgi:hypothetical protein